MNEFLPWLALIALGAFHGLNPGMGWLFAVALALHRGRRRVLLLALAPIAGGHALSIALVAALVVFAETLVPEEPIRYASGAALLGWAAWHQGPGRRHRVRIGLRTGLFGLAGWSFLMATAHGAGLMLVPALVPLTAEGHGHAGGALAGGSLAMAGAVVGLHTAAMVAITGAVAYAVYQWFGLAFLRRGWINLDRVWTVTLVATGVLVIVL